MASSDVIRLSPRLWLFLGVCLVGSTVPGMWVAAQPALHHAGSRSNINPQPVRLPLVAATDDRFVRLSTAQGLAKIKVDHIVQDDQGFMWFGTRWGLYRYDGYSFKVFVNEPGDPTSLDGVSVESLFKDHDGTLWIGCDRSLNKFDRATETFKPYPIPFANHITQDAAGMLWISGRGGLYSLDPTSGRIQHSYHPNDRSGFASNDLSYCGEDKRGVFWVAESGYLDEFDRRAGKVTRRIPVPGAPHGFNFYEDRFGVFWIYHSSPNPLGVLDRETQTLTNYAFPEREPTVMHVSAMMARIG